MTLASLEFLVFLLAVVSSLAVARVASRRVSVLLFASYAFYLTSGWHGVVLVAFTSIVDFNVGRRLGATDDIVARKRWLLVSLISNLSVLGLFKYASFLTYGLPAAFEAVGIPLAVPQFEGYLPIGISYFTFTGISYVLDVYYERMKPCGTAEAYLLYVAYFPKILAGPLVRAREFLPQIQTGSRPSAADIEVGVVYLLVGAVKKVVIADQLADHVSLIFAAPSHYDGGTLLQGLIGYTVQIYCDFSGYSDMAIGCARIMGIRLPENFLMPYSAVNITEFWRRWHVTLSNWFRDYVFLPLEISTKDVRSATVRTSSNLVATMLLCGLWHGAGWNFLIWGGIHGVSLALHRAWRAWVPAAAEGDSFRGLRIFSSRVLTLSTVMLAWIFFRAYSPAVAADYIRGLLTWQDGMRLGSPYILPVSALVFLTHLAVSKDRNWVIEIPSWSAPVRVGAYGVLLLWLGLMANTGSVPFVYLQF